MSRKLLLVLGTMWGVSLLVAVLASLLLPGLAGGILGALASLSVTGGTGGPADLFVGALYGFVAGLGCGLACLLLYSYMLSGAKSLGRVEKILKRDLGKIRRTQDRMTSILDFTAGQKGKAFGADSPESGDGAGVDISLVPKRAEEMRSLDTCPVCGHGEYTIACEYNRFVMRPDAAPDAVAARYDYAVCHACGVLFATRRPTGDRYMKMLLGFNESLGRAPKKGGLLNPNPLDEEDRADLRRRAKAGVFVSEHEPKKRWLPAVLRDRMANAEHVELIGSLLDLQDPRVLELRPRTGCISHALHRLYGADAYTMPMFESQQFVVQEYYDLPADHLIDYEKFEIPYEGPFDLVVSNHIFTHIIEPQRYFGALREKVEPGGHLYLYNEPDDAEFLKEGSIIFSTLNPFHLQTFDLDSLVRALRANGFEPEFVTHTSGGFVCLARRNADVRMEPISASDLRDRVEAYQRARDVSIIRLDDDIRPFFEDEWPAVVKRVTEAKIAHFDEKGRLIIEPQL